VPSPRLLPFWSGVSTFLCVSWWFEQRKHPSALSKFEEIAAKSRGKKIVMFMDYDGTLSPIVADPDTAYMSDAVSHQSMHRAAICSGHLSHLFSFADDALFPWRCARVRR
jgi:hypothetical protein